MTYTWHDIDGRTVEICDECGFDARELTGNDDEQRRLDGAYAELERLLDHPDADRRPAPETWSAREYVEHCLDVATVMLGWVADLTGSESQGELTDLAACRRTVAALVPPLTDDQRAVVQHGEYAQPVTVEWLLDHLLHDTEHHVLDLRRGYASLARAAHPEVSFRG
ncbi:DinB family protein [Nocardioides currus]|uniref:DinB-like domain-containing protein n=1 Tax=Nocardioides currus TaxID=2133958 RepID=A0A2R7YUY8_9ACTN|nr:DinB family protein [Nocardioides currus]PUA79876.1 hypothetical protein C7S10_17620 [Nocardioides currus]